MQDFKAHEGLVQPGSHCQNHECCALQRRCDLVGARKASSPQRHRDTETQRHRDTEKQRNRETEKSKTLNRKGRKGKIRVTGSSICYEAEPETVTAD